jgi:hypothetical protein
MGKLKKHISMAEKANKLLFILFIFRQFSFTLHPSSILQLKNHRKASSALFFPIVDKPNKNKILYHHHKFEFV